MARPVPSIRLRRLNAQPVRPDRGFVLYWMIAARRASWNHSLDRAIELAVQLERPLIVLEPLRVGYRWASERLHAFVLEGMVDNERAFDGGPVLYHPYVEPREGDGRGLVEHLASQACAIVTDEYPTFFLPRMTAAAAARVDVRMEAVDSLGLLPLRATEKEFTRAFDLRRYLQRELPPHLAEPPRARPDFAALHPRHRLPSGVAERWPRADPSALRERGLASLPIDHSVGPVEERGGTRAARARLRRFLDERLARYDDDRNQPDAAAASELSSALHFGHLSVHEVLHELARREEHSLSDFPARATGKRTGWWGMSAAAEGFLDELVTWREVGHVFCHHRPDHARFESLPPWARATLAEHAGDRRPHVYDLATFEAAATHEPLWNAAQHELRATGRMHNYLRMLWGKKILHWSESPRVALDIMIELNNKYALDGRDPNSYSGIFWVLGRFDRAWGPEREVFGKIRYMSCANTRRKLRLDGYLERWAPQASFDW